MYKIQAFTIDPFSYFETRFTEEYVMQLFQQC